MSSELMTPAGDKASGGAFATRASRVLDAAVAWWKEEWPLIRAEGPIHALLRALVVAALSFLLVPALFAIEKERNVSACGDLPPRSARQASNRRAAPLAPPAPPSIVALAPPGDGFPLDSDFSLEQAALTWSRRFAESEPPADNAPRADDTPSVLQFGPMRVQRSIAERVVRAAKSTGSDPALLMAIADKESSFSPSAKASTSTASGLFQFVESTWLKALRTFGGRYGLAREAEAIDEGPDGDLRVYGRRRSEILGLRNDPYLSAALAAEMLKRDGERIAERLGRPLTAGETYLIHFLGPDDAERFMAKVKDAPHMPAALLLPRPARANRPIFFARDGRRIVARSVGEVHAVFEEMMGQRSRRYRDVEAKLPSTVSAYAD